MPGQGPFDTASGAIVGATIMEQTRQCLAKVQAILDAAGSSLDQIVSMTFLLGDPADFAGTNEEWRRSFPTDPPARAGSKAPHRHAGVFVRRLPRSPRREVSWESRG